MNNNIDTNPCGPISEADKLRIFAAYASDDLTRLHAEFGFPESQPIDVDDMIAALRLARPAPASVKSVGEDATRAINGILRVVDADKTGDLHLLLGDDIETLTNCIDSLLAARTVADAGACKGVPDRRCNYLATCGSVCNKCGRIHTPYEDPVGADQPTLTVWYGPMPESNGKSNFTATLMRKGGSLMDSCNYTFEQSEYPERVRYAADSMRYLIGEIDKQPCCLDYDSDKHSGYTAPVAADQPAHDVSVRDAERFQFMMDWQEHNDQPEEILVMWRKVYAENRVKPTRAEYEAAIDEAIRALRSQPAKGDSNE